jgi:flagellar hook assembly protein FlgD
MDGYQDFCFINYHLPDAGFMGSISIYDIQGRLVHQLVNNILWGNTGSFRWDGRDEQQHLLPMGHYIIYCELFTPDGIMKKKKLVCVLARKP